MTTALWYALIAAAGNVLGGWAGVRGAQFGLRVVAGFVAFGAGFMCALCHDEDYEPLLGQWAERSEALLEEVEAARAEALDSGVPPEELSEVDRRLEAVRADGSRGAHHFELTVRLLEEALRLLEAR